MMLNAVVARLRLMMVMIEFINKLHARTHARTSLLYFNIVLLIILIAFGQQIVVIISNMVLHTNGHWLVGQPAKNNNNNPKLCSVFNLFIIPENKEGLPPRAHAQKLKVLIQTKTASVEQSTICRPSFRLINNIFFSNGVHVVAVVLLVV